MRREQAKRDKAVSSFLPRKSTTGGVMLMGNRRWFFTILRYAIVTILVLRLLTIKAC